MSAPRHPVDRDNASDIPDDAAFPIMASRHALSRISDFRGNSARDLDDQIIWRACVRIGGDCGARPPTTTRPDLSHCEGASNPRRDTISSWMPSFGTRPLFQEHSPHYENRQFSDDAGAGDPYSRPTRRSTIDTVAISPAKPASYFPFMAVYIC